MKKALNRRICLHVVLYCLLAQTGSAGEDNWQLGPFTRPTDGPVISPDRGSTFDDPLRQTPVHWEALHTFNPAAIVKDNKVVVLYRAEDDTGEMQIGKHTSRIGFAESSDGIHFQRLPVPVFFADKDSQEDREWPGGVEDPRVVESDDGRYVMTYTQWNGKIFDIGVATSRNLKHWTKHGPVFSGKYSTMGYKSSGILTRVANGRLVTAKVKNKYWMYWGEGSIHLATSDDLVHWSPLEDKTGKPISVLQKRAHKFDSSFPETGPPPVLTTKGIVMIYNGKNDPASGDRSLGANAYSSGQALFDAKDPSRLLRRTGKPFFKPELPFEKSGQYIAGTTFAEGLVLFRGKWFLYYGCADSKVGVAVAEQKK